MHGELWAREEVCALAWSLESVGVGLCGVIFFRKNACTSIEKAIFSLARAEAALAKNFLCGGARAKKADFLASRPAIQKMLQWEMLKNAQNRVFGGLEANYNQNSIFCPKGRASQSLQGCASRDGASGGSLGSSEKVLLGVPKIVSRLR